MASSTVCACGKRTPLTQTANGTIGFGEPLLVLETRGEWVWAKPHDKDIQGWVHSYCVTSSKAQIDKMAELDIRPTAIVYIADLKDATSFRLSIVEGRLRLGEGRALAEHANCIMLADEPALATLHEVSTEGLGCSKPLSPPSPARSTSTAPLIGSFGFWMIFWLRGQNCQSGGTGR